MSWFQQKSKKPRGFYNASSAEYACISCAYYSNGTCQILHATIAEPRKKKCGDFLRHDHSIVEAEAKAT